jgi:hypothetical protein
MTCNECIKMKKYLQRLQSPIYVYTTVDVFDITTKASMKITMIYNNRFRIECFSQDFRDGVPDWSWKKSRYVSTKSLAMVLAHKYSIVDLVENRTKYYFNKKSHHYVKPVNWYTSCAEVRLGLQARYVLSKNMHSYTQSYKNSPQQYNKPRNITNSWRRV